MLENSKNILFTIDNELSDFPIEIRTEEPELTLSAQLKSEYAKLMAFFALLKFRLSALVVFSSAIGYMIATEGISDWRKFVIFCVSSFIITGAANTINQVIERRHDLNMKRTQNRPLPTGVLSELEAIVFAVVLSLIGGTLLLIFVNHLTAALAMLSLVLYAFVYTPSKRISPISVFIGAFPGAFPPLIGYVAASGNLDSFAWTLFAIQFVWQFPHFWAIAWLGNDDYTKAGFKMLPTGGKTKSTTVLILLTNMLLIPMAFVPYYLGMSGITSVSILAISAILFMLPAIKLLQNQDDKSALMLMFASFFYLPITQLALLFDKV